MNPQQMTTVQAVDNAFIFILGISLFMLLLEGLDHLLQVSHQPVTLFLCRELLLAGLLGCSLPFGQRRLLIIPRLLGHILAMAGTFMDLASKAWSPEAVVDERVTFLALARAA